MDAWQRQGVQIAAGVMTTTATFCKGRIARVYSRTTEFPFVRATTRKIFVFRSHRTFLGVSLCAGTPGLDFASVILIALETFGHVKGTEEVLSDNAEAHIFAHYRVDRACAAGRVACRMYQLLAKLPKAPASLCPTLRTILLAASHVATGDATAVTTAFRHLPAHAHDKAYELTILQAPPFIGIPRALHSAASLQAIGIVGNQSGSLNGLDYSSPHLPSRVELRAAGETTFDVIYGRNAGRVRSRLRDLHPALDDWIVTCAYGALLTRAAAPELDISLRERELCAVAMLCVDPCASVQLASHLRGAIKAGATAEEVGAVVGQTGVVCGAEIGECAEAVWATYERARYAL